MRKSFLVTTIMGIAACGFAQGLPLEDFESYPDQAAFIQTWIPASGTDITLQTSDTKFARHGLTASRSYRLFDTPLTPSDSAPVVVEFQIRVPESAQAGRATAGIGVVSGGAVSPVIDIGVYNNIVTAGWSARTNGGAPDPAGTTSWHAIGGTRTPGVWTQMKAILESRRVRFYVEGATEPTMTVTRTASDFPALNAAIIGTNTSSVHTVDFDNFTIYVTSSVSDWSVY